MPDPEIAAGSLDARVALLAPVYNEPIEDEITSWQTIDHVWAAINPNYAMEQNESGRTIMVVQTPIVIRYRPDIDARWRVQWGSHTYEVEGILNVQTRNAQLQLLCKEIL